MLHLIDDSLNQKCLYCNRVIEDPLDSFKLIDASDAIYTVSQNLHAAEICRESQLKQEKIDEIMNRVEIALEHSNIVFEDNSKKKGHLFSIEKEKTKYDERQTLAEIFGFLENSRLSRNQIIHDLQNWLLTFQEELELLSETTLDEEEIGEENFQKFNKAFRNSISKMNRLNKLIQNGVFAKDNRKTDEVLTETTFEISKSSNSIGHGTTDLIKVPRKIFNEKELEFTKNLETAIKSINAVLENAISGSPTKHAKNNFTYCSKQFNYVSSHLDDKKKSNEELTEKLKLATVDDSIFNALREQSKNDFLLINDLQNQIDNLKNKVDSLENQIRLSERKAALSEYKLKSFQNLAFHQSTEDKTVITINSPTQLLDDITTNAVDENRITEELPPASNQKILIPSRSPSKSLQSTPNLSGNITNRSKSNLVKQDVETPIEVYSEEKKNESISEINVVNKNDIQIIIDSSSKSTITIKSSASESTEQLKTEKINSKHENTSKTESEKNQKDIKHKIPKQKKKALRQTNSNEHIDSTKKRYDQKSAAEQFERTLLKTKMQYEKKLQTLRNFIVNEQHRFDAVLRKMNLDQDTKIDQLKNVNTRIIQALIHFQHVINRLTHSSDEDYKISDENASDLVKLDQNIDCESKNGYESKTAVEILVDLERKIYNMILKKNQTLQNVNSDKIQFAKDLQQQRIYLKQIVEAFSVQKVFAKDVEIKNTMLNEDYKKVLRELVYLENPSNVLDPLQHISHTSFYKVTNDLINQKDVKKLEQEIQSQSSKGLKNKLLDFFENHQIANSEASIAYDIINYIQDLTHEQFIALVNQYVSFKKIQQMKSDIKDVEKCLQPNFENYVKTLVTRHSEKCAVWKNRHDKLKTRKKTAILLFTKWFQQLTNTKIALQSFPLIHIKPIVSDANKSVAKAFHEGFNDVIVRLNCYKKTKPEELGEIIGTSLNNNKLPDTLWKMPDKSLDHIVHVYTPKILELDCNKKATAYKESKYNFPAIATLYP